MKNLRKICVITGTRAEYGILQPVMKAIQQSKKLFLQVLVVGMHLMPEFGMTIEEIKKDGFNVEKTVKMTAKEDTEKAMTQSIGKGIIGIADCLKEIKPDIVLVLGDRIEALSAAIAAAYMNIIVAHSHGGDSAGAGLDEYARHAITKFSHIHFPASKKSAERIIKMGEDRQRVFTVGAPGLDSILKKKPISSKVMAKKYNLDLSKPILLVIQHPLTTEVKLASQQMKITMEAVKALREQTIVIYPNADAGGRKMIKVIEKYRRHPFIKTYKSLPHIEYLALMQTAKVMVGNSSSGIIETSLIHLPAVNIGTRQEGRERAENVIDVPHNKIEIIKAIKKTLFDKKFRTKVKKCKNPYGDGRASERIVKILSEIKIDKKLLQKKLTY